MEKHLPGELSFVVDGYKLTVKSAAGRIQLQAYSELTGRLLQEELTDGSLPTDLKNAYGDCATMYELMQDAVSKNDVTLGDTGEVRFNFNVLMGKMTSRKTIAIVLKEIGLDQLQKLERRVFILEAANNQLTERIEELQSTYGMRRINLEADSASPFARFLAVEGRRLRVGRGATVGFPLLLTKVPLTGRSSCRIVVREAGNLGFGFGIIAASLRNTPNPHEAQAVGVLYVRTGQTYFGGALVADGNRRVVGAGDELEMQVDLTNWSIQWNWVRPLRFHLDSFVLPKKSRNIEFFPYIQFDRDFTGAVELL